LKPLTSKKYLEQSNELFSVRINGIDILYILYIFFTPTRLVGGMNGSSKWQRCWSSSRNAPYWFNSETNDSVWTDPDNTEQKTVEAALAPTVPTTETSWVEKYSTKHNAPYWHNSITGASVWVRPEGFISALNDSPAVSTKRKADAISSTAHDRGVPVERWFRRLTNPPVHVTQHRDPSLPGKTFTLLDDGYTCVGGTKQRLLGTLLQTVPQHEIVYAGPDGGMAQVAMAFTSVIWGKKAVVFLNGSSQALQQPLVRLAVTLGADVRLSDTYWSLKEAQQHAETYVNASPTTRMAVPFGLRCERGHPIFETFRGALLEAITASLPSHVTPTRLWLVAGSGFILDVLYSIWPSTEFMVVQVGKKVWREVLEGKKYQLFEAMQRFADVSDIQPTYPTVPWYDAKLWQFVVKHGRDGDFIWNVAKVPDDPEAAGREALELIESFRNYGGPEKKES
jgi:hypothetical protein